MATLYRPDGTHTVHSPAHPPEWSLAELQFLVGGYIELVRISKGSAISGKVAYCDEDGRRKQLPLNARASRLVGYAYVGPVLVIDDRETS